MSQKNKEFDDLVKEHRRHISTIVEDNRKEMDVSEKCLLKSMKVANVVATGLQRKPLCICNCMIFLEMINQHRLMSTLVERMQLQFDHILPESVTDRHCFTLADLIVPDSRSALRQNIYLAWFF